MCGSIRVWRLNDKNPLICLTTFPNSSISNLKNIFVFFSRWIFISSKNNNFFPFFPTLKNFLFYFILTIASRTSFMSGDASSLPPFVPYLEKNKGFSLNIKLHVAVCYTGILCYPRLGWIEACIQIVG